MINKSYIAKDGEKKVTNIKLKYNTGDFYIK